MSGERTTYIKWLTGESSHRLYFPEWMVPQIIAYARLLDRREHEQRMRVMMVDRRYD
jgi:hypothetical protein